jgi:hypothetical protein
MGGPEASKSHFLVYSVFNGKVVKPPRAELGAVPYNSTPIQITFEYYDSKLLVDWTNRLFKRFGSEEKEWKPLKELKEKLTGPQKDNR